ncbi:MAG TPA: hypothetical protein VJ783_20565 [Pirellulales bacterium]|nr:hypothetical protein [Pirellulales bacterium]
MRIILGMAMLLAWIWAACSFEIREVALPVVAPTVNLATPEQL